MNSNPDLKVYSFLKMVGRDISGISVTIMMFLITANVLTTNIFNFPLIGSYEITQYYLMPLVVLPALILTYDSGILPKFSIFTDKGPLLFRKALVNSHFILELLTNALLCYYGMRKFLVGMADRSAVTLGNKVAPLYPVQIIIPIGFACVVVGIISTRYLKTQYVLKDNSNEGGGS